MLFHHNTHNKLPIYLRRYVLDYVIYVNINMFDVLTLKQ